MKNGLIALWLAVCLPVSGKSQQDSLPAKTLEEIVLSVNKWEQKINEVPNKIARLTRATVLRNNPPTAADLLAQTGSVFIQKSQMGGGSPMIRGFATSRVLIVVDGVRMNNAIYRSGNLQNVISIDALSTETAEVIFGPGSITYGSDAIGGVMDFHSLEARFSNDSQTYSRGNLMTRYATVNKEITTHADFSWGNKKWAFVSSASFSRFDDLKMGRHGGPPGYLRPEYITRKNNTDVIIQNSNPRLQRFSGYDQLNLLQKIRYRPGKHSDLQYSFTFAKTGDVPRYDRLLQYRNGALRFAEWNYGPMKWQMHNLRFADTKSRKLYNQAKTVIAYQHYEESRIDRAFQSNTRNIQTERVEVFTINWDATKKAGKGELFYGTEYAYNHIRSHGKKINISNGTGLPAISRYPDGSRWSSAAVYSSYKINLHRQWSFTAGLRYNYNLLKATFDSSFISFPYDKTSLSDGAMTGTAGLVFRPAESWQLNGLISTGYRMPNIDDMGKLFESVPGSITVPNPGLKAEYAWNIELAVIKNITGKFRFEVNGFHSILQDAITRRSFQFNGQDSILFDGTLSRVEALQNVARATVWGLHVSMELFFSPHLSFQTHANRITGKETDDVNNEQVPLRHAPPFYGSSLIRYQKKRLFLEGSCIYNSVIRNKDLAPSEQAKTDIYAKDQYGLPYSPGWYTINLRSSFSCTEKITVTAAWENITNQRYRPYSSGIVAAGSNFIVSLRASL